MIPRQGNGEISSSCDVLQYLLLLTVTKGAVANPGLCAVACDIKFTSATEFYVIVSGRENFPHTAVLVRALRLSIVW